MELETAFESLIAMLKMRVKSPADVLHGKSAFSSAPVQLFIEMTSKLPPKELDPWVERAAEALAMLDDYQAGRLARVAGALVERGGKAEPLATATYERLGPMLARTARLARKARLEDGREGAAERLGAAALEDLDGYLAWTGLENLGLAARACLARVPALLEQARRSELREKVSALAKFHPLASELRELFETLDGEPLTLLFPLERRGHLFRLENVRTNFQLFSLLQCTLLHRPEPPKQTMRGTIPLVDWIDPHLEACRAARGRISARTTTEDRARWSFHPWQALGDSGALEPTLLLEGPALPRTIPLVGTDRVVLAGPIGAPLEWDAAFLDRLHPRFYAAAQLERDLSTEEVDAWLTRIRAQRAPVP